MRSTEGQFRYNEAPGKEFLAPENLGADTLAAGGQAEIDLLYREHNESLIRFLAVKLGSRHEARDIAQEAYVKILGLDQVGVVNHLRAYLFRTANNLAINRLKQRIRRRESQNVDVTEIDLPGDTVHAERVVAAKAQISQLGDVVACLPPKFRMAFLLYKVECLEYAEIADRMDISQSMVRKYVLQAVRYCHDKIDKC